MNDELLRLREDQAQRREREARLGIPPEEERETESDASQLRTGIVLALVAFIPWCCACAVILVVAAAWALWVPW